MEQSSGETGPSIEAVSSSADSVENKLDLIDAPSPDDSNSIVIKHRRSSTTSRQSSILNGKRNSSSSLYSSTIINQGKSIELILI